MPATKKASSRPRARRRTTDIPHYSPEVLQLALDASIRDAGLPAPTPEYRFARSIKRQWRIDRAWPDLKIALEIEGGVHLPGGGSHQRAGKGGRYLSDMQKYNQLALWGWVLIRTTYDMIADGTTLELVKAAFALREGAAA